MLDSGTLNEVIFERKRKVLYEQAVDGQNCWKFSQLKKIICLKPHLMFLYLITAK